ncbi:hypothetical protein L0F63_005350, partial [Massospora cicadina]
RMACHRETVAHATRMRQQASGVFRPTPAQMITEFLPFLSLMGRATPAVEAVVRFSKPSAVGVDEFHDGDAVDFPTLELSDDLPYPPQ